MSNQTEGEGISLKGFTSSSHGSEFEAYIAALESFNRIEQLQELKKLGHTRIIVAAIAAALDQKKVPPMSRGAMCYMMSKQGYLNDLGGRWHPHVMFFEPLAKPDAWGANLDASPIFATEDTEDRVTIFMIPVSRWSDGTADTGAQ